MYERIHFRYKYRINPPNFFNTSIIVVNTYIFLEKKEHFFFNIWNYFE